MTNQTKKKAPINRGNNELEHALRSIWLDRQSVNGTFSTKDYDPNFNMAEVLEVLEDDNVEEDKSC